MSERGQIFFFFFWGGGGVGGCQILDAKEVGNLFPQEGGLLLNGGPNFFLGTQKGGQFFLHRPKGGQNFLSHVQWGPEKIDDTRSGTDAPTLKSTKICRSPGKKRKENGIRFIISTYEVWYQDESSECYRNKTLFYKRH